MSGQDCSKEFQEMMISEFLRSNPGAKRSEIVTRNINGKTVITTIQQTFKDTNIKKRYEESVMMKELITDGDERFMMCLDSVNSARSYIETLVADPSAPFNEQDLMDVENSLQRRSDVCMRQSKSIKDCKKKMTKLMDKDADTTSSAVQILMSEMMDATEKQLRSQHKIYKDEIRLAEAFSKASKEKIQTYFKTIKSNLKERSLEALKRAFAVCKKETHIKDVDSDFDPQHMEFLLEEIDVNVKKRRAELDTIAKVLEFVQQVQQQLKIDLENKTEPKQSRHRMAKASNHSRTNSFRAF